MRLISIVSLELVSPEFPPEFPGIPVSPEFPYNGKGQSAGLGIDSIRVSNDGRTMAVRFDAQAGSRIGRQVEIEIDDKDKFKK